MWESSQRKSTQADIIGGTNYNAYNPLRSMVGWLVGWLVYAVKS